MKRGTNYKSDVERIKLILNFCIDNFESSTRFKDSIKIIKEYYASMPKCIMFDTNITKDEYMQEVYKLYNLYKNIPDDRVKIYLIETIKQIDNGIFLDFKKIESGDIQLNKSVSLSENIKEDSNNINDEMEKMENMEDIDNVDNVDEVEKVENIENIENMSNDSLKKETDLPNPAKEEKKEFNNTYEEKIYDLGRIVRGFNLCRGLKRHELKDELFKNTLTYANTYFATIDEYNNKHIEVTENAYMFELNRFYEFYTTLNAEDKEMFIVRIQNHKDAKYGEVNKEIFSDFKKLYLEKRNQVKSDTNNNADINDITNNTKNKKIRKWNEGPKTVRIGSKYLDVTNDFERSIVSSAEGGVYTPDKVFNKEKAANDYKKGLVFYRYTAEENYKIDPRKELYYYLMNELAFSQIPLNPKSPHPTIYGENGLHHLESFFYIIEDEEKCNRYYNVLKEVYGDYLTEKRNNLIFNLFNKSDENLTLEEKNIFKNFGLYIGNIYFHFNYPYRKEMDDYGLFNMLAQGRTPISSIVPALQRFYAVYDFFGTEKKRYDMRCALLDFLCDCITPNIVEYLKNIKIDNHRLNNDFIFTMPKNILPEFVRNTLEDENHICQEFIDRVITPFVTEEDINNMIEFLKEDGNHQFSKTKFNIYPMYINGKYHEPTDEELISYAKPLDEEDVLVKYEYSPIFQKRILDEGYDGVSQEKYDAVLNNLGDVQFTDEEKYMLDCEGMSTENIIISTGMNSIKAFNEYGRYAPIDTSEIEKGIEDIVKMSLDGKKPKTKKKGLFNLFKKDR